MKKGDFKTHTKIKKGDFVLTGVALLAAGFLFAWQSFGKSRSGGLVEIMLDGEVTGVYSIHEDREVTITGRQGYNVLQIQDGVAKMIHADCPDQYCVKHEYIKDASETIVCLPHKLVVQVVAGTKDEEGGTDVIIP